MEAFSNKSQEVKVIMKAANSLCQQNIRDNFTPEEKIHVNTQRSEAYNNKPEEDKFRITAANTVSHKRVSKVALAAAKEELDNAKHDLEAHPTKKQTILF